MPTIKGFMAVSNNDFVTTEDGESFVARATGPARAVYLSRGAAEENCLEHQSVEPVILTLGENDFFRFQHGTLKSEYTDYRHYRSALRRLKAAKHPYAEILWMQQYTEVTDTITFADDKGTAVETATCFEDRWLTNAMTFPERAGGAQ